MDFLTEIMEKRSNELLQKYASIKSLNLSNPTDEGTRVENLVIDFLRDYLPSKYGICRGYIISTKGERSLQQDIIIYNTNDWVFFKEENYMVLPIEAVYITIEVKSDLNVNNLKNALNNIKKINSIKAHYAITENIDGYKIVKSIETHGDQIRSFIFSFESNTGIFNIGKYLVNNNIIINGIFILSQGILVYSEKLFDENINQPNSSILKIEKKVENDRLTAIYGKEEEIGSFVLIYLLFFIVNYIDELNNEENNKRSKLSKYYKIKYQYIIKEIEKD
jgi:hypothetical protein